MHAGLPTAGHQFPGSYAPSPNGDPMTRPGRSSSPHVLPVPSTVPAPATEDPESAVSVPPVEGPAAPELPAAGSVWQNREFRAVWVALVLSLAGDQLARVALTVLLYAATGSAVWAASGGVVSLLGPIVGGPLLGGLADRYSRRAVMIGCDLASAALIAVMAAPGIPLVAMVALLLAASVLIGPFTAARSALIRDVFPDDGAYARAVGVNGSTFRFALTVGLIGGGGVVATLGARPALLADAATFLLSALLLRWWVRARPAAAARPHGSGHSGLAAARLIAGDPVLRTCTLYGWLAAAYVVPAGVVAPLAAEHGGGAWTIGVLLAVPAVGAGLGTWILTTRVPPAAQARFLVPGSLLACAPLMLTSFTPQVPAAALLWGLSGAGAAYQIVANVRFQQAVPNDRRAAAFAVVSAGLLGGQGLAMLAAAALSEQLGIGHAVAVFGAAGTVAALLLAPAGRRLSAGTLAPTG